MVRTNSRTSPLFGDAARFVASLVWRRSARPPVDGGMQRSFLSRALSDKEYRRRLLNRERIEQIAQDAGFAIVHPEQMPLLEQFALLGNARQIVGEYGSALHMSIFSAPGTMLAALLGNYSPVAGFLQSAVGEALAQPTGYVFGETVAGHPMEPFTIPEEALRACLELIFGSNRLA
jgi:capsular polysaccharide biosynthesis protein